MPPDAFGPFRVLHQIGLGTLGPVFRAYDPNGDRLVAIKLFRLDLDPARLQAFVEELQRLIDRHTPHPFIPTPLAAGVAGSSAFLAQTFVAAASADTVLRGHGPMPLTNVLRTAAQAAEALDSPVGLDAGHGALHPRDLLLAADDTRVTGFGVTKILERLGIGAPVRQPYTAPERVAGTGWDRRADVFSLAAVVGEMITGMPVGPEWATALERLPEVAGVHRAALGRAFARALAERPNDRFPTAAAFVSEVKALLVTSDRLAEGLGDMPLLWASHERGVGNGLVDSTVTALPLELKPTNPGVGLGEVPLRSDEAFPDATLAWGAPGSSPEAETLIERAPDQPSLALASSAEAADVVPASGDGVASRPVLSGPSSDASQSALWPLSLALVVGLVVGAAVGFITFITRSGTDQASLQAGLAASTAPRTPASGLAADLAPPANADRTVVSSDASSRGASANVEGAAVAAPAVEGRETGRQDADRSRPVGTTDRAERANAESGGRVLVRSLPSGARVLLDGKDMGSTPVPLRAIPFGGHTVSVVQEGYEAAERRVSLTPSQPSESLIVDLAPLRSARAPAAAAPVPMPTPTHEAMAGLIVESRPPGATVFLNDRRLGTTPLTMDAVATGSHAIRLELDGYRRWSSSVRVAAGERKRVNASLEQ